MRYLSLQIIIYVELRYLSLQINIYVVNEKSFIPN